MSSFKRLNPNIYQKSGPEVTPDFIYWKKLTPPVLIKEFGPINSIDFSPIEPYNFAVACSVRVQIYNPITKAVVKNLSRFRQNAYGAVFKSDGAALCAGGEETNVKLFDVSTKSLLRLFKGHMAPVHRVAFVHNQPKIASFSDDKTFKIWDIPTEANLFTGTGHTDYIRSGAVNPSVPDVIISGSYDNTVKMYDVRTESEVMSVDHLSPVESVLFLPSGGIFLSAGGTEIKIWDVAGGGKLLGNISQHHKTITCLKLASDNKRLMSGSLDRHVKIYDISTFKVVHTLDYPNAILSLGVSKNDDTLVAGLVDGVISVRRRTAEEDMPESAEKQKSKGNKKLASYQYASSEYPESVDKVIAEVKHDKEAVYDKHLRKFQFSKALESVLRQCITIKHPEITVALLQELIRRRVLNRAILNSNKKTLQALVRFFIKNITNLRFSNVLLDVIDIFLDTISEDPNGTAFLGESLNVLSRLLTEGQELAKNLARLQGMMHTLLASQISTEVT